MLATNGINATKLLDTIVYAAERHKHQRRKGQLLVPYINHPLKVARVLMQVNYADDVLIQGAILHDTLEDTSATFTEIVESFGTEVAQVVQEVTDDMSLPQQERKNLQVQNAPFLSTQAKKIRIADKICNLIDIIEYPPLWPKTRKINYAHWAKEVVDACGHTHEELEKYFAHVYYECLEKLQNH